MGVAAYTVWFVSLEDYYNAFPNLTDEEFIKGFKRLVKIHHLVQHWILKGPEEEPYFNCAVNHALATSIICEAKEILKDMRKEGTRSQTSIGTDIVRN